MNSPLNNLLKDTGLSKYAFAKAVGISPQALHYQLKMKNNLAKAFYYAKILKVNKIYGDNISIEIR